MTLPLYSIQPAREGASEGWQICLVFRDDILPIPNKWYHHYGVAALMVKQMEREDYAAWQQASLAPPDREYDAEGKPL